MCQHTKISHWFTFTSDNVFSKVPLNVSRSTSPLVYSTEIQHTRRLRFSDIAVIRGHCLAKARSVSTAAVRWWVWLQLARQTVKPGKNSRAPFCLHDNVSVPIVLTLEPLRWQISRETGTAAQLYWNRLTQCSSAGLTPLTALQIAIQVQEVLPQPARSGKAATLTKKPNYQLRKKKKKPMKHVRCIIIET